MMVSQIGESRFGAMKKYWMDCSNSIVKKKNTPEAKAVLQVLEYIQYEENNPSAAKAADISIEKHILMLLFLTACAFGDGLRR